MEKLHYKRAVEEHCKQCVYDKDDSGTWRQQVENCKGYSCRLYPVRPLPLPKKT